MSLGLGEMQRELDAAEQQKSALEKRERPSAAPCWPTSAACRLATSPKQIKELWSKVAELLNDEQTKLQRDVIAIPPVED